MTAYVARYFSQEELHCGHQRDCDDGDDSLGSTETDADCDGLADADDERDEQTTLQ